MVTFFFSELFHRTQLDVDIGSKFVSIVTLTFVQNGKCLTVWKDNAEVEPRVEPQISGEIQKKTWFFCPLKFFFDFFQISGTKHCNIILLQHSYMSNHNPLRFDEVREKIKNHGVEEMMRHLFDVSKRWFLASMRWQYFISIDPILNFQISTD